MKERFMCLMYTTNSTFTLESCGSTLHAVRTSSCEVKETLFILNMLVFKYKIDSGCKHACTNNMKHLAFRKYEKE